MRKPPVTPAEAETFARRICALRRVDPDEILFDGCRERPRWEFHFWDAMRALKYYERGYTGGA
jgi:hypothetical protein